MFYLWSNHVTLFCYEGGLKGVPIATPYLVCLFLVENWKLID